MLTLLLLVLLLLAAASRPGSGSPERGSKRQPQPYRARAQDRLLPRIQQCCVFLSNKMSTCCPAVVHQIVVHQLVTSCSSCCRCSPMVLMVYPLVKRPPVQQPVRPVKPGVMEVVQ